MARVFWPTDSSSPRSTRIGCRFCGGSSTRSTAMSLRGSVPTSSASKLLWSCIVTEKRRAPWTTWKLVTTCPWTSQMNPDPVPTGTSTGRENRSNRMFALVTKTVEAATARNTLIELSSSSVRACGPSGTIGSAGGGMSEGVFGGGSGSPSLAAGGGPGSNGACRSLGAAGGRGASFGADDPPRAFSRDGLSRSRRSLQPSATSACASTARATMTRGNGRSIAVSIGQKGLTVNAEAIRSRPAERRRHAAGFQDRLRLVPRSGSSPARFGPRRLLYSHGAT
jgi:hypothetical protein